MLTETLLNTIFTIISLLLSPLKYFGDSVGSMSGLVELLTYANIFVPLNILAQCLGIWLAFQVLQFTMSIINWIIGKIPTVT